MRSVRPERREELNMDVMAWPTAVHASE